MDNEMGHLRVTHPKGFDYQWSKAGNHTSYPYGFEGTVKRAVVDAAMKAGKGEDMDATPVVGAPAPKPKRVRIQDDTPQLASELDASDGA